MRPARRDSPSKRNYCSNKEILTSSRITRASRRTKFNFSNTHTHISSRRELEHETQREDKKKPVSLLFHLFTHNYMYIQLLSPFTTKCFIDFFLFFFYVTSIVVFSCTTDKLYKQYNFLSKKILPRESEKFA